MGRLYSATAMSDASTTPRSAVDLADPAQFELALRVGYAWREMRRGAAAGALRDHFFGVGVEALEPGQMDALDLLVQRTWRMGDLADALHIDPSGATRAVQRLARAGLVERSADPDDRRVVVVSVTDAGRDRHESAAARRTSALARILAEYETDELGTLVDMMERFVAALEHLVAELGADKSVEA